MSNVTQPDFRIPVSLATVQVEGKVNLLNPGPVPLPVYIENISIKDDPQGTIKAGKSGHK